MTSKRKSGDSSSATAAGPQTVALQPDASDPEHGPQSIDGFQMELGFQRLIEQAPAITYIATLDEASTTLYVSPQVETILGYSPREYRADPDIRRKKLHPDDREYVLAQVARCCASGEPFDCEYRMLGKAEQIVWFRDAAVVVGDGSSKRSFLYGIMVDITAQKLAQVELEKSEQRFRELIENIREVFWLRTDHQLLYVSPAYEKLWMCSRESLYRDADSFLHAVHPDDQDIARRICEIEKDSARFDCEFRIIQPDGAIRWIWARSFTLPETGQVVRTVTVADDITERKQVELMLREREAHVQEQARRLEEVNSALRVLLREREHHKEELESSILTNITASVSPIIQQLKSTDLDSGQRELLGLLESRLQEIASPFVRKLSDQYLSLAPGEIRIARLIKEGKGTKEIAKILHLGLTTVLTHRQNIRCKLGLKSSKVNLQSFLATFDK